MSIFRVLRLGFLMLVNWDRYEREVAKMMMRVIDDNAMEIHGLIAKHRSSWDTGRNIDKDQLLDLVAKHRMRIKIK